MINKNFYDTVSKNIIDASIGHVFNITITILNFSNCSSFKNKESRYQKEHPLLFGFNGYT